MGNPAQVYMIGGGEFANVLMKSHKECRKLLKQGNLYTFQTRADLKYARHGHSACSIADKYIAVTAGRIGDGNTCEIYDVNTNKWNDLPKLNTKRHYHSSCVFENSSLFVFCGINNDNRSYVNTIERLDISLYH
jgi:hypothetical protein